MRIVAETRSRPSEETHWAIDTFFRNSDMLRLLASAKYLPDLRDVSRLASTNARTREVLSGLSDLTLCREICAKKKAASLHTPKEGVGRNPCHMCNGIFASWECRYRQACVDALYEKGNLRVARTFKAAMFNPGPDNTAPSLESEEIQYYELLGNGHFDVAIELAKTATCIPTLDDCAGFFKHVIWGLHDETEDDTIRLMGQRLLTVRGAFPHLGAGPQNIALSDAMRESAEIYGFSACVLSAIERNAGYLEHIFADDGEDSLAFFAESLVYSSFSSMFEHRNGLGPIAKRNGKGLGYLLRTRRIDLTSLASIFKREIRGNWKGHRGGKDKGFEYAERARRMLKAMYTETMGIDLDWRAFFLSPDMAKALEWILKKTEFSPLIATHMEERDQTAHELLFTERKDNESKEEDDERERRFADAFIATLKLRRAPDRLLEFVATVIRDGLPAKEPTTKRLKQ